MLDPVDITRRQDQDHQDDGHGPFRPEVVVVVAVELPGDVFFPDDIRSGGRLDLQIQLRPGERALPHRTWRPDGDIDAAVVLAP